MKKATLDRNLYIPLYHQLKEILLEEIRSGKLKPEDRLPSEDEVAAAYNVSVITVRRTLSDLASAGYIRRERGRGTFISHPPVTQGPRELTSFSHEMTARGIRATSRVITQKVVGAHGVIAESLGLAEGASVFLLRRVRLADSEPMGIQTAYIPLSLAPALVNVDFTGASLYDVLREKFGLVAANAREIHSAALIGADDAAILHVPEGSAGLAGRRMTFLADGRPLEYVVSIMRGDRYEIVLDLSGRQRVR